MYTLYVHVICRRVWISARNCILIWCLWKLGLRLTSMLRLLICCLLCLFVNFCVYYNMKCFLFCLFWLIERIIVFVYLIGGCVRFVKSSRCFNCSELVGRSIRSCFGVFWAASDFSHRFRVFDPSFANWGTKVLRNFDFVYLYMFDLIAVLEFWLVSLLLCDRWDRLEASFGVLDDLGLVVCKFNLRRMFVMFLRLMFNILFWWCRIQFSYRTGNWIMFIRSFFNFNIWKLLVMLMNIVLD